MSGDNVAISPAMFAYFYAIERKSIDPKNIRVVSVGATNELPDKLDKKTSLLEWVTRLASLNAPVKKHTMDFMASYLLYQNGLGFTKFQVDTDSSALSDLFSKSDRSEDLEDLFEDMIQRTDTYQLQKLVEDIVISRFKDKDECPPKKDDSGR